MLDVVESETEVHRRFTMRDGMILVASAAVAFGLGRASLAETDFESTLWLYVLVAVIAACVTSTPTLLVLSLLQPRPPLSELCRRPGFVASLAGSTVMALGLLAAGILGTIRVIQSVMPPTSGRTALSPNSQWALNLVPHFGSLIGPAVIASWVVVALSGRRRPSRDWFDYGGRAVGAIWIGLFLLHSYSRLAYLAR